MVAIEARPYGPDSTPEERQALEARVDFCAPGIVVIRVIPRPTIFSIDLFFDKLEAITAGMDSFVQIVDLCDTIRPKAEVREHLRRRLRPVRDRVSHMAMVVGGNTLSRVAARFVFAGLGFSKLTIHETLDQALAEVRRGRG